MNRMHTTLMLVAGVGIFGIVPVDAAARRDTDRTGGATVLQPNYLNQKEGGFARPVRVTFTPCFVKPLMEAPIRDVLRFEAPCVRAENDFKFERGPLVRSRGQGVSGLGLGSAARLKMQKQVAATSGKVASRSSRATLDKSGFVAFASTAKSSAPDCCGGSVSTHAIASTRTVHGVLK